MEYNPLKSILKRNLRKKSILLKVIRKEFRNHLVAKNKALCTQNVIKSIQ